MKTSKNTVLVTGGGSGIGFEIAKRFSALGNTVIISGRNEEKLQNAVSHLADAHYIPCDVTDEAQVTELFNIIQRDFPQLNILVNNAGFARMHKLGSGEKAYGFAASEMDTNYLSVIRLTEKLLPVIKRNKNSAIINVSSVLAFSPAEGLPTYSASKAALHSYSQILRHSLREAAVKVFELMPPLVDTEFTAAIPSTNKISPALVAEQLIEGLNNDIYEIRVESTREFYRLYLSNPELALEYMNAN
jgi:uncharacterized oxidoreductase